MKAWLGTLVIVATGLALLNCGGSTSTSPVPATPTTVSQADALQDAGSASGKLVGTAIQSRFLSETRYTAILNRHFNYITAEYEMKWEPIEHNRGVNNFSGSDAIVAYAEAHGMQVKGHTLIWHRAVPAWANALSAPELRTAFEHHIRTVAGHYRGRVLAWDVVNEAVADDGSGLRNTLFRQKLGDQYIADAFRLAREVDPHALLFYNDYNGEGLTRKSEQIYQFVKGLLAQGVPIDGVGLQMHVVANHRPTDAHIAANMRRLAALGLLVNISEMDVRIKDVPGTVARRFDVQKSVYRGIVGVCVAVPRCHAVTFWGFTDAYSWIARTVGEDDPLLFDEQYAPKPAYFGVLEALFRR